MLEVRKPTSHHPPSTGRLQGHQPKPPTMTPNGKFFSEYVSITVDHFGAFQGPQFKTSQGRLGTGKPAVRKKAREDQLEKKKKKTKRDLVRSVGVPSLAEWQDRSTPCDLNRFKRIPSPPPPSLRSTEYRVTERKRAKMVKKTKKK